MHSNLEKLCAKKEIRITNIEHLYFRERYKFASSKGKATIDFLYDGDNFFSSVEEKDYTDADLMIDLYEIVTTLKQPSYVV